MKKQGQPNFPGQNSNFYKDLSPLQPKVFTHLIFAGSVALTLSLALAGCGGNGNTESTPQTSPALEKFGAASLSSTGFLQASLKPNANGLDPSSSTDRFIVKYKDGTAERKTASAVQSRLDRRNGSYPAKARHLRRMGIGSDVVTSDRKLNSNEAKMFMQAIASDPDVEYVEPDAIMYSQLVPNDPKYSEQWGLTSNQNPGRATAGVRVEKAWDITQGTGSVIAIVDTGITSHSDLDSNTLPGYDFTSFNRGGNGSNPGITGEQCTGASWHGTHVAGIAAALTNNGVGIAGVAPSAKIVSVRVLDSCGNGYASDAIDGITWAAGGTIPSVPRNSNPARVINLSLAGFGYCGRGYQSAIDYANSQGAVVVVAAGNNNTNARVLQPANCGNVITVAGTNPDGRRAWYSNFGDAVDVAAPGTSIVSTYNSGTLAPGIEGYEELSGTSMATPFVSGIVALLQSAAPVALTAAEIRTLITQNAQSFPIAPDRPIGIGIADAYATVAAAKHGKIPVAADFVCSQTFNRLQMTCKDLSSARGAAPIVSWRWDRSEAEGEYDYNYPHYSIGYSANPTFDFSDVGDYNIRLTVTDSTGATSTSIRPVYIGYPENGSAVSPGYAYPVPLGPDEDFYFQLNVPPGVKSATIRLNPGPGEGSWLYLAETPTSYNSLVQSEMKDGNPAIIKYDNIPAGRYWIIVKSFTELKSSTLNVTFE